MKRCIVIAIAVPFLLLSTQAAAQEAKVKAAPKTKVEVKIPSKVEVTITKAETKVVTNTETKATAKTAAKTTAKAETKTAAKATAPIKAEAKSTAPASQPVKAVDPGASIGPVVPVVPVTPAVDSDNLGVLIKGLLESTKAGKWALALAFLMMLATWLVNKVLKQKIPPNVLPWVSIGLAIATALTTSLSTGEGWLNAVVLGVQAGLMAAGSWSAFGKYLPGIGKKTAPPASSTDMPFLPGA